MSESANIIDLLLLRQVEFAHPLLLWGLLLIPVLVGYYIWRLPHRKARVKLSTLDGLSEHPTSYKSWFRHSLLLFRCLAVAALLVALARPQSSTSWQDINTEGIDIVIALDISGSMLAQDFKPNRLEASKSVAIEFISGRPTDRIGLVVYSAESFTQCPLTTDHDVLKNLFKDIKNGMIKDGTAIGMGLANAVNRLQQSDAESKVVILLTDGSNTTGSIPPLTAAEIAQTFGVRVYTIGVGSNGTAPYPFRDPFGNTIFQDIEVKIDENTLNQIAEMTGGTYFRATSNTNLRKIYEEINKLEKSIIEEINYEKKSEEFWPWALLASLFLALEFVLRHTVFRSIT